MSSYLDYGDVQDDKCLRGIFGRDSDSSDEEMGNDDGDANNEPHQVKEITKFPSLFFNADITIETSKVKGIAHQLWPASFLLCRYLEDNHSTYFSSPSSTHVVELGAGVGLGGILCGMFGCCSVVVTDLPEAMELIDRNIQLNQYLFPRPETVRAAVLRWGVTEDLVACSAALGMGGTGATTDSVSCPDIFEATGGQPSSFLVVAADCVYWEHLYTPFYETLLHFTSMGGIVLLSHVKRWKKEKKFFALCARSMAVEVVFESVDMVPDDDPHCTHNAEHHSEAPPETSSGGMDDPVEISVGRSAVDGRRLRRQVSRVYVFRRKEKMKEELRIASVPPGPL